MIHILTGIAKSGKTTLAKHIQKQYGISCFATDYVMMMLHRGEPEESFDIWASDSTVAKHLEPYLEGLIETMVDHDETVLIEGVHFNTDFARRLLNKHPDRIRIVYLGFKDVSVEDKRSELNRHADRIPNRWYHHMSAEEFHKLVEYLIDESRRIHEECKQLGLQYIEVSNLFEQEEDIIHSLGIKK